MALTAAEKQAAYRQRRKVTRDGNGNAPSVTVTPAPDVTTEQPIGNWCKQCGEDTKHKLVVKCGPCCWGRVDVGADGVRLASAEAAS